MTGPKPLKPLTTRPPQATNERLARIMEKAGRLRKRAAEATHEGSFPEPAPAAPEPPVLQPVAFVPRVVPTPVTPPVVRAPVVRAPAATVAPPASADAWPKTCKRCASVTATSAEEVGTLFGWRTMTRHRKDGTAVVVQRSQPYCRPCRNAASKASAAKKRAAKAAKAAKAKKA